jgi:uncharacterized membrane protein
MPPAGPPGSWSATEAIGFGWNAVMKNFAGVVLPLIAAMVVAGIPAGVVYGLIVVMTAVGSNVLDPDVMALLSYVLMGVLGIAILLSQSWIMGGVTKFLLRVTRGDVPPLGEVFTGMPFLGRLFIGNLLFFVGYYIGALLCVVPGVIFALGCSQWMYLVVDRGLSPVDALKASWALTTGHKGSLFLFFLLSSLVAVAGYIACGVGIFVAIPIIQLAQAYVYLRLQGEQPRLPAGA